MMSGPSFRTRSLVIALWLQVFLCPSFAQVSPPPISAAIVYDPPIQIKQGGTYSGNWQSLNPSVPAVSVTTSAPVIIENCNIRSQGDGIASYNFNANITVRNCIGEALNPNTSGKQFGNFIVASNFTSLIVEHNLITGFVRSGYGLNYPPTGPTAPSDLAKFSETIKGQTVIFRYNVVHNVEGRFSDGNGGFTAGNYSQGTSGPSAAFQTYFVRDGNTEIAWNEIVNAPFISQPEDLISTAESRGLLASPIHIHDNFIQGDNPANAATYPTFSGCGIQIGDSPSKTDVGYVHVHDNQVVNFSSCGISISSGHKVEIDHNRIISARNLPDGTALNNSYRFALQLHDYYWDPNYVLQSVADPFWLDNSIHDNAYSAVLQNGTNAANIFDHLGTTVTQANNIAALGHLATTTDEQAEFVSWKQKLNAAGVTAGPQPAIVAVAPNVGVRNANAAVTLTGTGFVSGMAINAGIGITVSAIVVVNSTTATATFAIAPTSTLHEHTVTTTTSGGTSNGVTFTVQPLRGQSDFNGDSKADLIWYNAATGQTSTWLMNGGTQSSGSALLTDPIWRISTTADFNGDGNSDILWYNSATGTTAMWLMNGGAQSSGSTLLVDPNLRVSLTGDFNGDGKADLLWYNAATGTTSMWLMNGLAQTSGATLLTDPNWKVTATADFNGDGNSDLIWYNAATGMTAMWLMNGTTQTSGATLLTDPNWKITFTPDLNGDGKSDLVWYNAATGQTAYWLMNGTTQANGGLLLTDPNWKITLNGDLNGDGKTDLIWYNAATGQTAYWLMNGGTQTNGGLLLTDPNWKATGAADLNGDGRSDLVWYNALTGQTAYWLMNGGTQTNGGLLLTDPNWKATLTGQ